MSGLESAATKAGGTGRENRRSVIIDPSAVSIGRRANFDFSEQNSGPQRARLDRRVADAKTSERAGPTIEGEVRVRFNVDTQGRPVMTTVVSSKPSPSPLLTSAVRTVIPGIRFEPARSGGADSKSDRRRGADRIPVRAQQVAFQLGNLSHSPRFGNLIRSEGPTGLG